MITDQKTQNRLHAETGTELFSIRQRKEAVTRMLDILKETPEYLQVMNHIPAYAMDDDTSEWWNSEESENFMNSHLLSLIAEHGVPCHPGQLYSSDGAASVLGNIYLAYSRFFRVFIVVIVSVEEHYDIGVLLYGSRFSKVRQHRPVVGSLLRSSGKLGKNDYRAVHLSRQKLQLS